MAANAEPKVFRMSPGTSEERDIRDAVAYPILTEPVDLSRGIPSAVGGPSSGSNSLGKVVDQALRDVLG